MILALQSSTSVSNDWWASLKHGGLLIAPSKLNEFFVVESLPALPRWIEDRLRRDVTRLQNGEDEHLSTLLDTVLENVLGLTGDWQKGSQVDRLWSYPAITREIVRPRRVWQSPQGDVLPVFVADGQDGGKVARLGIGRGKRSVTRVVEWLRKANQKVALLTNGYQWRLIHAGADYDAWCEWDITFWFEEGQPGLQVTALRLLLGVQSLQAQQASGLSPLIAAIDASRQGQGEISEVLGERVRQAVELLIRESSASLTQLSSPHPPSPLLPLGEKGEQESGSAPLARSGRGERGEGISSRHIYIAATRIIMRCVVILFAEARDLLPRDNPIYHSAYGLQGLREQLDRRAGGRATERLRQGVSAWSRLLALFKLVYEGCAHEALPVPQYGGGLFAPGDRTARDPVLRALYAFENDRHPLSDAVVYRILELLCRSKVRVRQGRSSTWVEAPVDFSDLSSEYIGILYEGLLDFELRQAEANDPIIFLNLGDQPALPLTRLEGMSDKALATLVEKLKQKEKGEAGEEGEAEVEAEETEAEAEAEIGDDSSLSPSTDALLSDDDQAIQLHQRAHQWAVRAVEVGKLVTAPRSKKPEALAAYEKAINQSAAKLIARVVLPGEWFLVRWGGTRKGSGTFYTDPRLALPTTRLMLQPLLYEEAPHPPTPSPTRGEGEPERWEISEQLRQKMVEVAREFRKEPTRSETILWEVLRSRQLEGYKFRRQQPIGVFVVDFFCSSERLIIEIDGGIHESQQQLDQQRQELLESLGLRFVRIKTEQVETDLSSTLEIIRAALSPLAHQGRGAGGEGDKSTNSPHPLTPSPTRGEGEQEIGSAPLSLNGRGVGGEGAKSVLIPKTPEDILKLKVCDPAMGSGSFLLAALRYLADALYESLHYYDRIPLNGTQVLCRLPDGKETNLMSDRTLPVPPDHPEFESRLKAALKRFLVEWCIYGVDIDPLAVEFARLSLWVETMDRTLSFSFLDHKLKCGNSLVGCWFEQFQDYPVMAWERDGGDKDHDRFLHHFREFVVAKGKKQGQTQKSGDVWNQAIKDMKASVIRSELKEVVSGQLNLFADWTETPKQTHAEALKTYQETHLAVFNPQEQELTYRQKLEDREEYQKLRQVFDTWCAVWFWSPEYLEIAPTPRKFDRLSPETARIVGQLTEQHQFFHWELEFPDVFADNYPPHPLAPSPTRGEGEQESGSAPLARSGRGAGGEGIQNGFNAVIGNPPWEIQKPNSKEFFSNIDPLYRTYGKQEALIKQQEYFEQNPNIERDWLAYCDRLKALSNWSRYAACPFGDYADEKLVGSKFSLSRSAKESLALHDQWRRDRAAREVGFTTRHFPFRNQGSADVNTYKLFSELGYTVARKGGRFGFITPSGIYSDKGSGRLRDLFLKRCNWTHLYAFQNERFVFGSIHHSFKMVVAAVTKGSETELIATRFRLGPGDSPEAYELVEDILSPDGYLPISVATILQFSPNTGALLEIRTQRDLMILEKMYANGILLGDTSPEGWGIRYATEFHMTNDSKLFPPRPQWEAKGYRADEYGHWLKGNWREVESQESEVGVIRSVDGRSAISIGEVEDVALPLYQGIMIRHLDFAAAAYESGFGNRAVWRELEWGKKRIVPQFLISAKDLHNSSKFKNGFKIAYRRIAPSTNSRTLISTTLNQFGSGDSLFLYVPQNDVLRTTLTVCGLFCTFTYDYQIRIRLVGANLSEFIMADTTLPQRASLRKWSDFLCLLVARLSLTSEVWSAEWIELLKIVSDRLNLRNQSWQKLWAITPYERLRLRAILDAIVAHLYGLDTDDFAWILRDCDHPIERVNDKAIARTFDPKGFWRVDKDKPPELRHTVLSQVAFQDLKAVGLEAFLNLNDGEGWMLPEKLRLADYGLGNSDRANEFVPVAEKMGERFLPWQLEGTPEESWAECDRHAENLKRLLGNPPHPLAPSPTGGEGEQEGSAPLSRSGRGVGGEGKQLTLLPNQTEQLNLFDPPDPN